MSDVPALKSWKAQTSGSNEDKYREFNNERKVEFQWKSLKSLIDSSQNQMCRNVYFIPVEQAGLFTGVSVWRQLERWSETLPEPKRGQNGTPVLQFLTGSTSEFDWLVLNT